VVKLYQQREKTSSKVSHLFAPRR